MEFTVIVEEDEDGEYVVNCPAIKGCWSQGETMDEALKNIKEAIIGCLKSLNERTARISAKNLRKIITQVAVA